MRAKPVIAIDGPAGAGKTTVARGVARALGYLLVDTGALYRALAYAARQRNVSVREAHACEALADALVAESSLRMEPGEGEFPRVILDGKVLGSEIRTPEISMDASTISAHPGVRKALLELQRALGQHGGVVLEGRDIGTVVFPDAEIKVFLTASVEQRAHRRHSELVARGEPSDLEETMQSIRARDRQDTERAIAPLKPAETAVIVDSSAMRAEQVIEHIATLAKAYTSRSN